MSKLGYRSFIYKSLFLHSSSSNIKFKNVCLGNFHFWEYVLGHWTHYLARKSLSWAFRFHLRTLIKGYLYHLPQSSLHHNHHKVPTLVLWPLSSLITTQPNLCNFLHQDHDILQTPNMSIQKSWSRSTVEVLATNRLDRLVLSYSPPVCVGICSLALVHVMFIGRWRCFWVRGWFWSLQTVASPFPFLLCSGLFELTIELQIWATTCIFVLCASRHGQMQLRT